MTFPGVPGQKTIDGPPDIICGSDAQCKENDPTKPFCVDGTCQDRDDRVRDFTGCQRDEDCGDNRKCDDGGDCVDLTPEELQRRALNAQIQAGTTLRPTPESEGEGKGEGKGDDENEYDDDEFETYDGCPEGTTEHPDGKTRSDGRPVCLTPEDLQRLQDRRAAGPTGPTEMNLDELYGEEDAVIPGPRLLELLELLEIFL